MNREAEIKDEILNQINAVHELLLTTGKIMHFLPTVFSHVHQFASVQVA